jgi:hypothetical protein
MRGDYVIVRTYGDVPKRRRVWDVTPRAVFVCTDERYERLNRGVEEIPATGFPITDVFYYDEATFGELLNNYKSDPSSWERLVPYSRGIAHT